MPRTNHPTTANPINNGGVTAIATIPSGTHRLLVVPTRPNCPLRHCGWLGTRPFGSAPKLALLNAAIAKARALKAEVDALTIEKKRAGAGRGGLASAAKAGS
jgi:hypothetical protein